MYALTLGWGARASGAPLDLLLGCLYGSDNDDNASTPITGQTHHTLSANSPIMKTVLKLILKEFINPKVNKKAVMKKIKG